MADYLRDNSQISYGSILANVPQHNQVQNENATNIEWKYDQSLKIWMSTAPILLGTPSPQLTLINATGNYDNSAIGLHLPTFAYNTTGVDVDYSPKFLLEWLCTDIATGTNLDANNFYTLRPYVATIPQSGIVSIDSPIVINSVVNATAKRIVWKNVNYKVPVNKTIIGINATRTSQLLAAPTISIYQMIGQFRLIK